MHFKLFIGTYTSQTESKGIYRLEYNVQHHTATTYDPIPAINPSYLHYLPQKNILIYVEEVGDLQGKIRSILFDADCQQYQERSTKLINGSAPCHIAVDPDQHHIIVSNYSSGNFATFRLDEFGNISDTLSTYSFHGYSQHPTRQTKSHIHSAFFTLDHSKVYIQDLGLDKIYQFSKESIYKNDMPYHTTSLKAGSGPRHVDFAPNSIIYILNELESCIDVYTQNKQQELQRCIQRISLTEHENDSRKNLAAHIRISRDKRFLYVSNRGEKNTISVFKIQVDGCLNAIQTISSGGQGPRHFEFTEDQDFLFVANQFTNNICVFRRDQQTGLLENTGNEIPVVSPVFISIH